MTNRNSIVVKRIKYRCDRRKRRREIAKGVLLGVENEKDRGGEKREGGGKDTGSGE